MRREFHVRFLERLGVRLPRATRPTQTIAALLAARTPTPGADVFVADTGTTIRGEGGNDLLVGAATGGCTIDGGPGIDTLYGRGDGQVYVFRSGDGSDRVNDSSPTDSNILDFVDVPSTAVTVTRNDLHLTLSHSTGTVEVRFYYQTGAIQEARFSDGVVWDQADLEAQQ